MRADCLKNEDIAIKEHSAWRTKNRFQNPALAIAKSLYASLKNDRATKKQTSENRTLTS